MKRLLLFALFVSQSLSTYAQVLVYNQPPSPGGGLFQSSWWEPDGSDYDQQVWDDFTLSSAQAINELTWRGGFDPARFGSGGPILDFTVAIYASIPAGTQPDVGNPPLVAYQTGGNANQTPAGVFGGTTLYDYSFLLPTPFQAAAGARYWVQIKAAQHGIPDWGLAAGTGGNGSHFRRIVFAGDAVYQARSGDAAFGLKGTNLAPILIVRAPQSQVIHQGGTVTLDVLVQAAEPPAYQWQFNGIALAGATRSSLTLTNVQYRQAGTYSVILSNSVGQTDSSDAVLSVVAVAAWGDNTFGQATVPSELTNVMAISGRRNHTLALRTDGTVAAWGLGDYGQTTLPESLTNVVAISAGAFQNLALRADGTVVCWGLALPGQSGVLGMLTNAVAVAAGNYHSLALNAQGTVLAWGYNAAQQTNVPSGLTNVVAIAAGDNHSLALKADGSVVVWGDSQQTHVPSGLTNVVSIAAGPAHNLALNADGTAVTWGSLSTTLSNVPASATNIVAIACGAAHSLALKADGTLVVWGDNSKGQAAVPLGLTNVLAISGGGYHSLALLGDGPPVRHVLSANLAQARSSFSFSLPTRSGRVYRLEYKQAVEEQGWVALPLAAGNGAAIRLTDTTAAAPQRFYRVRQW